MQIGQHQKPVSGVCWSPNLQVLITSSWDGNIGVWDGRQSTPVAGFSFPQGIQPHYFSCSFPLMAVAASDKKVYIFNLNSLGQTKQLQCLHVTKST